MRKYRTDANSQERYKYGVELVEGLRFFPETAGLADPFVVVNDSVKDQRQARLDAELAVLPYRARVRFADFEFDGTTRSISKTAEIADGGQRGQIHGAIFPNGLGPVVVPSGEGQVKPGGTFVERFKASNVPGIEKVRQEWLPKAEDALAKLVAAVDGRRAAYQAVANARIAEEVAMDDHELAVEKLMGEVRATFPKDRRRWDVIFPAVRSSRGGSAPDADEPTPTPTPGPGPAPA